jgi:hypothetical protein
MLKRSDEDFHYARLFQLGQMPEIVGISIKADIELNNKLSSRKYTPDVIFFAIVTIVSVQDLDRGQHSEVSPTRR